MKQRADIPPARRAALAALDVTLPGEDDSRDETRGVDAQAALDQTLRCASLGERDTALTTELVYGFLRLGGRIEAVLSRFLKAPEKLPLALHRILGLAVYEILFLGRVPTYASVNWAVDAVRSDISPKLAGLANAVLRNVDRLGNEVHEKSFYAFENNSQDSAETLARFYSCPLWIVRLWLEAYGPVRAERLLRAQVLPPALGVSVPAGHPDHPQAEKTLRAEAEKALGAHPALLERSGPGFAFPAGTRLEPFAGELTLHRGSFAARQALMALGPQHWPEPVWDACSGRGGKTRVLRELGKQVVASDPHKGRIKALRAELPDVPARVASALDGPAFDDFALQAPRTILLDAPCSGLGVLSRRPDTKWRRTEADLGGLVQLQASLLDAAASHVSIIDSTMIAYLTCTLNPAENEHQVQAFLDRHPEFSLATEFTTAPASPLGEFFFAALLVRT